MRSDSDLLSPVQDQEIKLFALVCTSCASVYLAILLYPGPLAPSHPVREGQLPEVDTADMYHK